jgi:dihydroorotate dehydrogenase electron transfer subunit
VRLLENPINIDSYRAVTIRHIRKETPEIKTFTFKDELCINAKTGQYVMVWIQGVDEIPLSLSSINQKELSSVTVENVGEATAALHTKKVGDVVSIRGPYGTPFKLINGRVLIVGGGVGLAPLLPLLKKLSRAGSELTVIIGAKTKENIFSLKQVESLVTPRTAQLIITTEDGSYGVRGVATDPLENCLAEKPFDMIYTCGPEPMMRRVFNIAESRKVNIQACFERIIRCSVGLCGSCSIGKLRICKEGPVLTSFQMRNVLNEFGVFKRGFDGRKLAFKGTNR